MVKSIENKLTQSKFLQTTVIIITVILSVSVASLGVGKELARMQGDINLNAEKITALVAVNTRLDRIEERQANAPPDAFKKMIDEFKEDVKNAIKELKTEVKYLRDERLKK